MKEYFMKLFKYNEWANNRIIEALMDQQSENMENYLQIFSHLLSVQKVWLDRLLNNKIIYELWDSKTLEGCIKMSKESTSGWLKYLESISDEEFSKILEYTNTKGVQLQDTLEDILAHIINHSTYHRAQIALLLRRDNLTPPATDYILFVRELNEK